MPEPSWAEGYAVGVGYPHRYQRELSPAGLRFVTLLAGLQAADAGEPFAYYELGCGNGDSLTLHAAANPLGQFIGADFNPTHVHNARKQAQEAGVGNARFLEKSFAELAAMDLPEADFVALHGVYSWVSGENRAQIVDFIRRRLKPGGIAFVSYNCLPGLGAVAPLQRLLREHAGQAAGEMPERMQRAIEFAARLSEAGARYFQLNPTARARLAGLRAQDARYLVHEYFNAHWAAFYHMDVARELGEAKLTYAGSADYADNFDQFVLSPAIAQLAAGLGDGTLAETIKDFARNQVFRRDVFTRGAPRASPEELFKLLGRTRFALVRPRVGCRLQLDTPAGAATLHEEAYAPVLDALARAPMTFDELAQAPETAHFDRGRMRQALFGMAACGNVLPALPAEGEKARRASTARYNRAVLARPATDSSNTILASPVLGAGVAIASADRALLGAARDPAGHDEQAQSFRDVLLPFLRQLGVAD